MELTTAPLFISDRRLRGRKSLPVARGPWALDSGAFSELQKYGTWAHGPSPLEYAARVRRYRDRISGMCWAAPQDWMCEPVVIHGGAVGRVRFAGTKLTVAEHQRRTVANLLTLRSVAPDVPFIPVLQGHTVEQYLTCVHRYHDAGVDLGAEPVVGIGSICRRQGTSEVADIIASVCQAVAGIRLHGFGVKAQGLAAYGSMLHSSDSLAWSFAAMHDAPMPGCRSHRTCANCPRYAFRWREEVLARLARHSTGPSAYALGA
ncbi:hypothetical protein ACFZBG_40445 [Streptomyces lydicus]|uniref:deazapurine DNA modification protein DpdA family protein n=1 Tax=Streptomyces lydicus TaxID=47763 RepID=UPI0036EE966B